MKKNVTNKRLVIEADKGMMLTDGDELFVKKYEFPVGVRENETFYEITDAEYEALQKNVMEQYTAM